MRAEGWPSIAMTHSLLAVSQLSVLSAFPSASAALNRVCSEIGCFGVYELLRSPVFGLTFHMQGKLYLNILGDAL